MSEAVAFATRRCGHRVPVGRKHCPYCQREPMVSVAPLAIELRRRADKVGANQLAFEVSSRLGMDYDNCERQIRKMLQGKMQRITLTTADNYATALGGYSPATLWGQEWDDASPVEPYGDEDEPWE